MRGSLLLLIALSLPGACKRHDTAALAKTEERVVKAVDGRCPTILDATREGGLDEKRYIVPKDVERKAIREAVEILIAGGADAIPRASAAAKNAEFEVVDVPESGAVLLREAHNKRGGGAYLIRVGTKSNLFVQAPHTFYDEGTLPLGCELFARSRAGALFINTSHRYKSAPQTPGGHYPADVAHARDSLFQAATEGLLKAKPKASVVQVHGFGEREASGAMVLSAGVRTPGHPVVSRVALALSRVIDGGVLRYPDDHNELGATTNVQGAIVRESGGQFLHIEMGAPLRRDLLGNPTVRASVLSTLADAMEGA
jgi:hypothetical protein